MKVMNIYVLLSLLFFLAPGGCPIYSIDLSTLEVPNDFQNELTLQSMLSSELHQSRNKLNSNEAATHRHFHPTHARRYSKQNHEFDRKELLRSIEDRIKASRYAAASTEVAEFYKTVPAKRQPSKVLRSTNGDTEFLGTNLFGNYAKKCFSTEDIALLSARQDFEILVPKSYPHSLLSDGIVYTLMKYFNSVNQVVREMSDNDTKILLQRAFYDALGGYLRYYLLPVAQVSYYAGRLKLCTVERLVALYSQCRLLLNTNGNGWKMPVMDVLSQLKTVNIKPIIINEESCTEKDASNCALLDQNCLDDGVQNEQMLVALPHLESEDVNGFLSNIFLPFKRQRIYNLRSPDAAFIMVKFYKTLRSCYRFQGLNPKTYNQKLRIWIRENLQLHYRDEMFYPGLGGILQIYESLGCTTKSPAQVHNDLGDQGVRDNTLMRDYDLGLEGDSSKRNESKVSGETFKKIKQQDESNKQSRSLQLQQNDADDPNNSNSEAPKDAPENRIQLSSKDEECTDCSDEAYVGYIAAFLALFLIILLLIICCCLHRNKKDKIQEDQEKSEKNGKLEKSTDYTENGQSDQKSGNKGKGCWDSLFGKNSPGQNIMDHNLITGSNVVGGRHTEFDVEWSTTHKANDYIDDEDTMSSTSSLVCQFRRKVIPMKKLRQKRDEYYTKVEKRRESKKPQHRKNLAASDAMKFEDEAVSMVVTEPTSVEYRIREKCNPGQYERQEGRLASGQETVPWDRDSYMGSDENRGDYLKFRKKETSSEKESDKARKSLVINNTNVVPLGESNTQPHIERTITTIQPQTSCSSRVVEPSKYAASWETTFDEESK